MSTSTLRRASRPAATSTSTATKQRGDRVAVRVAGARDEQADEHGAVPSEVAAEVERARRAARRCAYRRPPGTRSTSPADVDGHDDHDDDRERVPGDVDLALSRAGEPRDRAARR